MENKLNALTREVILNRLSHQRVESSVNNMECKNVTHVRQWSKLFYSTQKVLKCTCYIDKMRYPLFHGCIHQMMYQNAALLKK